MQILPILVLIGLYFLKCTKFDQLILRKIIKIVATRCQILTLKCTKIDFGVVRPVCLLVLTILAMGLEWEVGRGRGMAGRGGGTEGLEAPFVKSYISH